MDVRKIMAVFLVFVACGVLWVRDQPVPEGFADPWSLRLIMGTMKLTGKWHSLKAYFSDVREMMMNSRVSSFDFEMASFDNILVKVEQQQIAGVNITLFIPDGMPPSLNPAVVFYHGGGFLTGSVAMSSGITTLMAHHVRAIVISVEYRLAPEHPYPAAIDDCFSVTKHILQNPDKFHVDPNRVAVAGDSAGGNLAAATALRLRDAKMQPQPKLQVLLYPNLQAVDLQTPSYQAYYDTGILSARYMAIAWTLYATGQGAYVTDVLQNKHTPARVRHETAAKFLDHATILAEYPAPGYSPPPQPQPADEKIWSELGPIFTDPYFAPLMADDLSGLPESLIYTMGLDPLRDDGIWYAKRLRAAGTGVSLYHYKAGVHGMASFFMNQTNFIEIQTRVFDDIRTKL